VHDRELCLSASADDRHYAVTFAEAVGTGTERGDLPRQLETGDVLRRAGRGRVQTAALKHVGAVQPGRPNAHEHLADPGGGVRVLGDMEIVIADRDRAHGRGGTLANAFSR